MPGLGVCHASEDRCSLRIVLTRRHRLVHRACFNLPMPRGEEAVDRFWDAPPISLIHHACPLLGGRSSHLSAARRWGMSLLSRGAWHRGAADRKSTRLNSSHVAISYAVFCLKKK